MTKLQKHFDDIGIKHPLSFKRQYMGFDLNLVDKDQLIDYANAEIKKRDDYINMLINEIERMQNEKTC